MDLAKPHFSWRKKCFGEMLQGCNDALIKGIALSLTDQSSEALKCLSSLTQPFLELAVNLAMIYTHKQCQVVDREAVEELEKKSAGLIKEADSQSLYYAALVYYLTGSTAKAKDFVGRHLRTEPDSAAGHSLHGWLLLSDKKISLANKAFLQAINKDESNALGVLGLIECCVDFSESLKLASSLVVRHPKEVTPLLAKMYLEMSAKRFTQAIETANRALLSSPNNIHALLVKSTIYALDGRYDDSCKSLSLLKTEGQKLGAWHFLILCAKAVSRSCGRCPSVLTETMSLVQAAHMLQPDALEPSLELAYQYYLSEDYSSAGNHFRDLAAAHPDSSVLPIIGVTMVQLRQIPLLQVKQQVEFLSEISGDVGAVLWMRGKIENSMELLEQAVSAQQTLAQTFPFGPEYLAALDLDLIFTIAESYPLTKDGMKKRSAIFGLIIELCPGFTNAALSLARSQISLGDYVLASETLKNILDNIDPNNPEAHLLSAQILLEQNAFDKAESSLELGLSNNLRVREMPQYHMQMGLIYKNKGDISKAIDSFKHALLLNKESETKLHSDNVGSVNFELVSMLNESGHESEAEAILCAGETELLGSNAEPQLYLARASLSSTPPAKAIDILTKIPRDSPFYIQAQKMKADIYFNQLKDPEAYTECFKVLVDHDPSPENLILLGDAYVAVQEAELAVESYERAMKGSTKSARLSCRLARLLVKCHQYAQAIKCYRDSGEEGCLELAELLLKLGQTDKAESSLAGVPLVRKALVLAKIQEKAGDVDRALTTLKSTYDQFGRSDPELSAKLCHQIAVYATALRDFHRAIDFYKKALSYDPNNNNIQIALAKLYLQVSDWSMCENVCSTLLSKDSGNEPALLMLADLAYRRADLTTAAQHFSRLLDERPDSWIALARLIQVLRRQACVEKALPYLEKAAKLSPVEPGLSYCQGLYHWYRGERKDAMEKFNACRGDSEWGPQAVVNMVEMCTEWNSLEGAQRLLSSLRPASPDQEARLQLLVSFLRLATQDKAEIERAIIDLTHLANNDAHRIGATLGLAMGYQLQKQSARVKNVLKRVAKASWSPEEAEYLERSWLILAETYISTGGKGDMVADLLSRVIAHNQSCVRAYELMAALADKEQRYGRDAGEYYKKAWNLSGEKDSSLGYKLALNFVKSKRYPEAVSTCQSVLRCNPEHPRIKKDVMDKALAHLRV